MIYFSLAEWNTRLPFLLLPKTRQLFPPDVIFITCERRPKSNNSSTRRLTVGCTYTKWLPEDGLIWHNLFCVDGICSNPLPATLPIHCATAGKQGGLFRGGLSRPDCRNKKGLLSENSPGLVHIYFGGKPPIAILCSLLLICLNIAIIKKFTTSMILSETLHITNVIYIMLHN